MRDWQAALTGKKMLITDGAWGTELFKRGLTGGDASERANLEQPDLVRAVADSYVAAGADIILTNSFGGTRIKLAKTGLDAETDRLNRAAADISRQAAGASALVFASIGPTGELLEPYGTLTESAARTAFAEQAAGLAAGGADGLVIETMTDLNEALAALTAAKESCDLPVVVSISYEKGPAGFATMMGLKPDRAAAELDAAGADVIGANCGITIADMVELVKLTAAHTEKPIWARPNAGKPELVDGATLYRETLDEFARHVAPLVEAGAIFVGGCCGTTPEHTKTLVEVRSQLA